MIAEGVLKEMSKPDCTSEKKVPVKAVPQASLQHSQVVAVPSVLSFHLHAVQFSCTANSQNALVIYGKSHTQGLWWFLISLSDICIPRIFISCVKSLSKESKVAYFISDIPHVMELLHGQAHRAAKVQLQCCQPPLCQFQQILKADISL